MAASSPQARIVAPQLGLAASCRAVLDALPSWFGIPESNDEYVSFVQTHPTWSAVDDKGAVIGVLAPMRHAASAEIYLIAVLPEWHRHGVGRSLVAAFEAAAAADGVRLLQVKTLGPSHPDEGYARTRSFYEALGYAPLEEFHDLWPDNPALIMVKPVLVATGEAAAVARTGAPITRAMVVAALRDAGLRRGSVAIVHSSLSRLGWVLGGGQAVVEALWEVTGTEGTIVMPSLSSDWSEPSRWEWPPVPEAWWQTIRHEMPAYDAALTPMTHMGEVVECFRHHPATVRSPHPADSFVANGPLAHQLLHPHALGSAFGAGSPLARLYECDAQIVLLGVGHGNSTSLHLAESRTRWASRHVIPYGTAMMVDGERRWVVYDDIDYDSDDFVALGAAFAAATGGEARVPLGAGEIIGCSMREIVDFGIGWLDATRQS